jgi:CHAT domain-containing protein
MALHRLLFGGLSRTVRDKESWVLSLDGPLFDLPFAALPRDSGTGFLIEAHSIQTVPGAFIDETVPSNGIRETFVGVADARYNAADPRWRPAPTQVTGPELARLPGTAREIRYCARAWGRDQSPVLLTGEAVTRERVSELLAERPAILHLAAHVMPHPEVPDQVMIALGLQPSGIGDYLSPSEIAVQRHHIGLVTLSGCGSGSGLALPGLGLFGLTRAWLLAGASAVVASHWPIADDSGELLSAMYEELRRNPGPITGSAVSEALRAAQLRMARSGGWRSDPAYWAAFAVVGKD